MFEHLYKETKSLREIQFLFFKVKRLQSLFLSFLKKKNFFIVITKSFYYFILFNFLK